MGYKMIREDFAVRQQKKNLCELSQFYEWMKMKIDEN